jgi:hypothetical protein
MQPKIYISYSWSLESDSVANTIEADWQAAGLEIIRDKNVLRYKDSLSDYMRSMDSGDYVLLLISKGYLESKNCMFEVLELFKNPDFKNKVLPIILDSAKIHEDFSAIDYIEHWSNKVKELSDRYHKMTDFANTIGVQEKLNLYKRIRDSIDGFISLLNDMLTLYWSKPKEEVYGQIFEHIKFKPANKIRAVHEVKSPNKAEPGFTFSYSLADSSPSTHESAILIANSAFKPINGAYNKLSDREKNDIFHNALKLNNKISSFSGGDEQINEIISMMENQKFMTNNYFQNLVHFVRRYQDSNRSEYIKSRLEKALKTIKRIF